MRESNATQGWRLPEPEEADAAAPQETPAIDMPRLAPADYGAGFLEALEARGEVVRVDEGWTPKPGELPPDVHWVLYPNGDLQRVRFSL